MSDSVLIKHYQQPWGLNLRPGGPVRGMGSLTSCKNVDYVVSRDGDTISQRKGFKCHGVHTSSDSIFEVNGGGSPFMPISVFHATRANAPTGLTEVEVLAADGHLWRLLTDRITLSYSGSASEVSVQVLSDGTSIRFKLIEDGSETLNQDLGNGDSSEYKLSELKNVVDALTDFSMTIGDDRAATFDGSQSGSPKITVLSGHTLEVGDNVRWVDSGSSDVYRRKVIGTTATTVNFEAFASGPFPVGQDGDFITDNISDAQAAHLEQVVNGVFSGGSYEIPVYAWEEVYATGAFGSFPEHPFTIWHDNQDRPSWSDLDLATVNNVTYLAVPNPGIAASAGAPPAEVNDTFLIKYDGRRVYRAGMPQAYATSDPTLSNLGAGNVDAGEHRYIFTYSHIDHQGNVIEGLPSGEYSITLAGNSTVGITGVPPGLFTDDEGLYPTRIGAEANGAQVGVTTIDVFGGFTIRPGEKIAIYDRSVPELTVREVESVDNAANTVTISGSAVDVNNLDPLSWNTRLNVYRTKVGGSDYYLVQEYALGANWATMSLEDDVADANLGAKFIIPFPEEEHGEPPRNCSTITVYQGSLVLAGQYQNGSEVFYSTPGNPEYYSTFSSFVPGLGTERIASVETYRDACFIFTDNRQSFVLTGTLQDPVTLQPGWRQDTLSGSLGCPSPTSLAFVEDSLFFLSRRGPAAITGSSAPSDVSTEVTDITPIFEENPVALDETLRIEHAQAIYSSLLKRYLVFIPAENRSSSSNVNNSSSRSFAFDVQRGAWREWTNIEAGGGFAIKDNQLWFLSKESGGGKLYKFINNHDRYDYVDHVSPIDFEMVTGAETAGEASVNKIFSNIRVWSSFGLTSPSFTLTVDILKNFSNVSIQTLSLVFTSSIGLVAKGIKSTSYQGLALKLSHNTLYEKVSLFGWELEVKGPNKIKLRAPD